MVDNSINPRAMSPGHVGIVFQDELYTVRTGNIARKLLALFGVLYGADSVVVSPLISVRGSRGSVAAEDATSANERMNRTPAAGGFTFPRLTA